MYSVSDEFLAQQYTRPFRAYLTKEDGTQILLDTAEYAAGPSGGTFTLGCAASASLTTVATDGAALAKGDEVSLSFALQLESGESEAVPMGRFTVTRVERETDSLRTTVTASDAMGTALEEEFCCADPENPPKTAADLLQAIASQSGLRLLGEELVPEAEISLTMDAGGGTGRTMRALVQSVALLAGANACIDRSGALKLVRPAKAACTITPERYYESGLQVEEGDFALNLLEITQTVTVAGEQGQTEQEQVFSAQLEGSAQGIQCSGEWFTQPLFDRIWAAWQGFSFRPGSAKCVGDIRFDLWDVLEAENRAREQYDLPVLALRHSFDGGIITTVTAGAPTGEGTTPTRQSVSQAVEGVKTELGRFHRLYAENLSATNAELKHITTEDITGEHGTINLGKGTFRFGNALCWDGENLTVAGTIQADSGSIGGWEIQPEQLQTTQTSQTYSEGVLVGEYSISAALTPPGENAAPGVTIAAQHWDEDSSAASEGGLAAALVDEDDPTRGMTGAELYYSDGASRAYVRAQADGVAFSNLAELPLVGGTALEAGDDLNQLTSRGKFYISDNATTQQVSNCPSKLAGMLFCLFPLNPSKTTLSGTWDNLLQIYINLLGDVFLRQVYTARDTTVRYGKWRQLSYTEV